MKEVVIVIDMQKDFVTGCLGTKEAKEIVPNMVEYLKNFKGDIIFTRDTHSNDYLNTQEGLKLPIKHCIENTNGWEIIEELKPFINQDTKIFNKPTFGSVELTKYLVEQNYEKITFVGVCTGICVISNVLMTKANLPETPIYVMKDLCACVTPNSHKIALDSMITCQVNVI